MNLLQVLTLVYFILTAYCLGYSLTYLFKKREHSFDFDIMRLGFGLALYPLLISILGLLRIPIDWKIFLLLSLLIPIYSLFKNFKSLKELNLKDLKLNYLIIIVILLFVFTFFMYYKGAFSYPYLEDDDPWDHAVATKYIAEEKTIYEPQGLDNRNLLNTLDARPPGYDGLMGLLVQINGSVQWTLKFFNVLIISLGILFFYAFAAQFFNSKNKALLAAFFLAMFPTYLTHFIWAHSYIVTMFFPALYCLTRINEDKLWKYLSGFVISGLLLIQETKSIKFAVILGIFFISNSIINKKLNWNYVIAGSLALLLSLSWWAPMYIKYEGLSGIYSVGMGQEGRDDSTLFVHPSIQGIKYFGTLGSATRQHGVYTFSDYFFAKGQNFINVPTGIGVVLCILIALGLLYLILQRKELLKDEKKLFLLLAFIFVFLGANGGTRWWAPFALYTFRFWLLLAIFGSLVAVYGTYLVFSAGKQFKIPKIAFIALIVIGVWFTSGAQKYELNTAQWPPGGGWSSQEELQGYLWLGTLPLNTKVFEAGGWGESIGFDKYSCRWCADEIPYYKNLTNYDNDQIYSLLKRKGYEYLIISGKAFEEWGINKTNEKIDSLSNDKRFQNIGSNKGFVVYKV